MLEKNQKFQSQDKFIIDDIYPAFLQVVNSRNLILVCVMRQALDELYLYTETAIELKSDSPLRPGSKINLAGNQLGEFMKQKTTANTAFVSFAEWKEYTDNHLYYEYPAISAQTKTEVKLITQRTNFILLSFMYREICNQGGFPKIINKVLKSKVNTIKIDKITLEGSRLKEYNDSYKQLDSSYILSNGPSEYQICTSDLVPIEKENLDLRIPTPDYVFDKVYIDYEERHTTIIHTPNESYIVAFVPGRIPGILDNTNLYIINKEESHKLSASYLFKNI